MLNARRLAWKDFPKSQDARHCSRLRSVALYLWLIVDILTASTVAAISGLHCWALVMVSSSISADSLIAPKKRRTVRRDGYEQSHRDYLLPGYLHHRLARHGLLIITVITPLLCCAQRDKNARELKLANAAITDMQMRQRDALVLADAKYTKELADAKAENDVCVMMLPLVVVGCTSKQSVSREATTPPAGITAASPDWQTPLNGIISPSERGWLPCKNNWACSRSILMSSVGVESCPYRWATHAIIV